MRPTKGTNEQKTGVTAGKAVLCYVTGRKHWVRCAWCFRFIGRTSSAEAEAEASCRFTAGLDAARPPAYCQTYTHTHTVVHTHKCATLPFLKAKVFLNSLSVLDDTRAQNAPAASSLPGLVTDWLVLEPDSRPGASWHTLACLCCNPACFSSREWSESVACT